MNATSPFFLAAGLERQGSTDHHPNVILIEVNDAFIQGVARCLAAVRLVEPHSTVPQMKVELQTKSWCFEGAPFDDKGRLDERFRDQLPDLPVHSAISEHSPLSDGDPAKLWDPEDAFSDEGTNFKVSSSWLSVDRFGIGLELWEEYSGDELHSGVISLNRHPALLDAVEQAVADVYASWGVHTESMPAHERMRG
jgi:hypothetical protein